MIRRFQRNLRERLRAWFSRGKPTRFAMDGERHTRAVRWEDEGRPARRDWWREHAAERDQARGYRIGGDPR